MPSPPYSFLQVEGTTPLSAEDAALLATILCPSPLPLPGENGVWRTPQPPAPSSPLEFGEGISAVFESLGLEATPTHQQSSRPAAPTKSSPLSANSSPFIPTTSRQASESPVGQNRSNLNGIHQATAANIPIHPSSQAIPIPLPSLASHHPGTIHINNFTANLNMNYHGAVAQEQQQQQYQHQQQQPQYQQQQQQQQQQFQQQQQLYQQQEQAAMAQQLHYQQQAGYPAMQGYAPAMGAPFMFVNMEMPVSSYQQGRAKEEGRGGGITFGSTPVVSVRAHTGGEDEGIEEGANSRTPATPSTPSSRSSVGYTAAATGPFTPPSISLPRLPTATPPHPSPQQQQSPLQRQQQTHLQQHQTAKQTLQQQPLPAATAAKSPTPAAAIKSPAAPPPPTAVQQPPLQSHQHVPVQGVTPTASLPSQNTKSNEISSKASPVKNPSNVPTVVNKTPVVETPKVELAQQVHGPSAQMEEASQPQPEPSKSWASLFAGKMGAEGGIEAQNKPTAVISPFSPGPQFGDSPSRPGQGSVVPTGDQALGGFLRDYVLKHTPAPIMPRGLTNRSNWCFVNAILQALLACPPLHNLLRTLGSDPTMMAAIGRVKAPMLDAMLKFVAEFNLLEPNMASNARGQKKEKNKSRRSDIVTGLGLEPSFVFNMLLGLETDTFKVVEGRQEDAEEFLTCLLNGLSDEMTEQIKLVEPERKDGDGENDGGEDDNGGEGDEEEEEEGWQEVGAKGKSCVTRRVAGTSLPATPIQALALGMCRSCVKVEGKDSSATLQPFYTLQLDIQDASIASVTDALLANFASEQLDGFVCGKTKQEVEATRSLSLEELPPVLILHLKRFVYDAATGGVQKVMKAVNFGVELEINKAMLSAECRSATTARHRQYKLFSVVCHNGREATKGHYVTDVFHPGYSAWLHCDDGIVQPTAEELVLAPSASSTPYILFYRRCDTMAGGERREM